MNAGKRSMERDATKKAHLQDDLNWMSAALGQAGKCSIDVPVGSVVVRDGVIVGNGFNRREVDADPAGHAEIIALRQAAQALGSWRLHGCVVYTTLEPCPMCAEAIIQSRVSRLVFGAYDPVSGACGSAFNLFVPGRILPIPEVVGGLREDDCKRLLVDFFRQKPAKAGEAS